MIDISQAFIFQVVHEVGPLLAAHHAEINPDQSPVEPDWEAYAGMERTGNYVLYAARVSGKLVGYSGFFLMPNLHAKTERLVVNDVVYLSPEYRTGITGIRLLKYGEQQLGKPGTRIIYACPPNSSMMKILPRMGYRLEETRFGKLF